MRNNLLFGSLLCVAATQTSCSTTSEKPQTKQPNVIFIYADDMGKGMLSCYGQKQFTTPNIDEIFQQGVKFENAYGCHYSAPARGSLITGYHDCQNDKFSISRDADGFISTDTVGVASCEARVNKADIRLGAGDLYLAQVFKEAGYVTGQVGKLEYGFTATRKQMKLDGWDYFYGYLNHSRCHGFYPPFLFENDEIKMIEGNTYADCGKETESDSPENYTQRWNKEGKSVYSQDLFLEKIISFIRENKDKPFFLYHPTQLPHGPVSIPAVHPEIARNTNLLPLEKEYASMVKMLDDHVGVIRAELEKLGIAENTIIIFSNDNGHELYYPSEGRSEKKPYRNIDTGKPFDDFKNKYYSAQSKDIFNGNADMAGLKRSNLEGGICVPLAFYWKGHWEGGRSSNEIVSNYDLLPTFADFLGVELKVQKDGISYLSLLDKEDAKLSDDRYIIADSKIGQTVVRNDGWKLRYYKPKKVFELYNLNSDPQERKDVAAQNPDIAKELATILKEECTNYPIEATNF